MKNDDFFKTLNKNLGLLAFKVGKFKQKLFFLKKWFNFENKPKYKKKLKKKFDGK